MRSSRWQPYLLISTVALLVTLCVVTRANSAAVPLSTLIAEKQVATWNCQDKINQKRSRASVAPWKLPKSRGYRIWVLSRWETRYVSCKAVLREQERQWNWQAWLPDKWRRIGICETGLNWQHSNSSYQGAFGFAIQSWDSFKLPGYPNEAWQATPWQQYMVALAIFRRYGLSGWGCRNA